MGSPPTRVMKELRKGGVIQEKFRKSRLGEYNYTLKATKGDDLVVVVTAPTSFDISVEGAGTIRFLKEGTDRLELAVPEDGTYLVKLYPEDPCDCDVEISVKKL